MYLKAIKHQRHVTCSLFSLSSSQFTIPFRHSLDFWMNLSSQNKQKTYVFSWKSSLIAQKIPKIISSPRSLPLLFDSKIHKAIYNSRMWLHIFFLDHKFIGALQSLDRFFRSLCRNWLVPVIIQTSLNVENLILCKPYCTSIKTALRFTFFDCLFEGCRHLASIIPKLPFETSSR
jgi:hypothetical protein